MSDMKWYVVHTYSGMEKSAESALRERIAREGLQDCFEELSLIHISEPTRH